MASDLFQMVKDVILVDLPTTQPRTASGFTKNELQNYIEVSEWFPKLLPALSMIQPGGWSVSC